MLVYLAVAALALWITVLLLPSRAYRTSERLDFGPDQADLGAVSVLIPARNEADSIAVALRSLGRQGHGLEVIVIDDHSEDGTVAAAFAAVRGLLPADAPGWPPLASFRLKPAPPLPEGWGGKLWALEQGLADVHRPYVLLMDADIELDPGALGALMAQARRANAQMVSVMATLRCRSIWERLLVPPFVFFFKLLYPFARVNDRASRVAAAAGGCVLIETEVLRRSGAFAAIRSELIDDCALAGRVKRDGYGLWLGLSHGVRSLRPYEHLADFWSMVTRTAFTQLRYSPALLALASGLLLLAFIVPPVGLLLADGPATRWVAAAAFVAMCAAYVPMTRFYGLGIVWSMTLPLASAAYLAMCWGSALRYWRGIRARWKDRDYGSQR